MIAINLTLLTKLFTEPVPQPDHEDVAKIYNKLFYRIFPCKDDFIFFLQAQSSDKQYEFAERIVHHLCYTSNYPPSFFAVKDIICVEHYQQELTFRTDRYIPRDHFIHLVYLYLLGIYIYFYNSEFYMRINNSNRFERGRSNHNYPKIDCVKDFISEWKYFCLYHDIGYVPEIFSNRSKIRNANTAFQNLRRRPNDFHSSLSKKDSLKQLSFFSAIEILSRVIVAEFIIDYSGDNNEHSKMFNNFRSSPIVLLKEGIKKDLEKVTEDVENSFSHLIKLEKVFSNACLKPLLPVLGIDNIVIIGVNKITGEVAFVSYTLNHIRQMICLSVYKGNKEIKRFLKDPNLVLFDDFSSDNFEFEYFLNERSVDLVCLSGLIDDSNLANSFALLKDSHLKADFVSISNAGQMLDFFFKVYMYLYDLAFPYFFPAKDTLKTDKLTKFEKFLNKRKCTSDMTLDKKEKWDSDLTSIIFDVIQEPYKSEIKNACIELIQNVDVDITYGLNDFAGMIDDTITKYIVNVKTELDGNVNYLKRKVREHHESMFGRELALLKTISILFCDLKNIFSKDKCGFSYDFAYGSRNETYKSDFLKESTGRKTEKILECTIDDVEKEYNIPHGNAIDHGFASSKYAASVFETLSHSIEMCETDMEKELIGILFSIPDINLVNEYKRQYIENYNFIFQNVLYAVFVHNLYPNCFNQGVSLYLKQTSIVTDPFTYFALLCDSLQQWNRPQSISPSLLDSRPYEHVSENYNIIVHENGIFLYENNSEKCQRILNNNIKGLTHLLNVEAFVKNGNSIT